MDLSERGTNENRHPWELSRTHCILGRLGKLGVHGRVLDIGCGDSYFDRRLISQFKNAEVYGVDIFLSDDELIDEDRLHTVNKLEQLPDVKFDFILLMDVLEHIEDDYGYLSAIKNKLADDGTMLITVPAFQKLYSLHDEELRHFRRYNHKQLRDRIIKSGLTEIKWSYFYFSLIIARLLTKNKTENLSGWDRPESSFITKAVTKVLNADHAVLNMFSSVFRLHIPGLSLLSICRRDISETKI